MKDLKIVFEAKNEGASSAPSSSEEVNEIVRLLQDAIPVLLQDAQRRASEPASQYDADIREYGQVVGRPVEQGDSWLYAYIFVKGSEARRKAWAEDMEDRVNAQEARALLQSLATASICLPSNAEVKLRPRVQAALADYLGKQGDISAFFVEGMAYNAENEQGEDISREMLQNYEALRGKGGENEWARLLGWYVDTFINAVEGLPHWAKGMNKASQYAIIGELLEKAGALEGCKGAEWVQTRWNTMKKGEKVRCLTNWENAYRRITSEEKKE